MKTLFLHLKDGNYTIQHQLRNAKRIDKFFATLDFSDFTLSSSVSYSISSGKLLMFYHCCINYV